MGNSQSRSLLSPSANQSLTAEMLRKRLFFFIQLLLPLYDHAVDYIPLENKEMIRNTKIIIKDKETNEKIVIKETYWNSKKNSIAERIDIDNKGETSKHEIIVTTIVQDRKDEKIWEIIRFSEADDIFNLDFHSFITENEEKLISKDIVSKD